MFVSFFYRFCFYFNVCYICTWQGRQYVKRKELRDAKVFFLLQVDLRSPPQRGFYHKKENASRITSNQQSLKTQC